MTNTAAPPERPRDEVRGKRQLRWVLPLAIICVAFVAFSLPPYLTFDPSQSRLPGLREGFPLYYPLLVTHIIFGSVALLAGCMQVWPWFRYQMARQRRFAEHREWMIRSFALTTSIVVNRLWLVLLIIVLSPQVDTTFGGDSEAMITATASASVWLSWVVNLLIAEWWLQRGRATRHRTPLAAARTAR